ncbi:MAG TPA: prolipoprotein diacylglyceryl transferase family protein [Gemmatimonadaceae bacterium]|nr:prolipoprotein diacylglyceryl transferase family protein [Gemmatimonadaceae bacterium]
MHSIVHHKAAWMLWEQYNLELTGFGIAMLLAFLIAQTVCQSELTRRGQTAAAQAMPDVTIGAVLGGLLGAKIYYTILTGESFFHRSGFVFWGGLIGGILVTFAVIRKKRIPFTRISDVAGIGIAAAYAVGRTGCWAVGDDYGRPWDSRFAVSFPEGAPPSTVGNLVSQFGVRGLEGRPLTDVISVYPTQILEVAMGLVMFAVLWRLRDHKHAEGWLFGLYCVLAGTERFIVEFFRAKDDRFFGTFSLAQVIAVAFVAAGFAWMRSRRDMRPGAPGVYATA